MNQTLTIPADHLQKLLLAANPDAALLYLYLAAGNDMALADRQLHLTGSRLSCAAAALRQLGLWQDDKRQPLPLGEAPRYTEEDVIRAVDKDDSFRSLYGEVQRQLGRNLNTEELKILLGFVRYLGLSGDVISLLVCYCKERSRQKGSSRNPSLRTIEKEAYAWAEQGIDTMEEAVAYICPVCWWENDVFISSDNEPSDENHGLTLSQGRANVRRFGTCDPRLKR